MQLIEYRDRTDWARGVADIVAETLRAALLTERRATLIAAGGATPIPIYRELSHRALSWQDVTVIPSDERWVAPDSPRSNLRMISDALATGRAHRANLLSLHCTSGDLQQCADHRSLAVGDELPAHSVIVGMGADAHTASLFPWSETLSPAFGNAPKAILPVPESPAGDQRLTLSLPALRSAGEVEIVIAGADKLAVLKALGTDRYAEPITALLDIARVHVTV